MVGREDEKAVVREERLMASADNTMSKPESTTTYTLQVTPLDGATNVVALEQSIRSIQKDGLVWCLSEVASTASDGKILKIGCILDDEKVVWPQATMKIQQIMVLCDFHLESSDDESKPDVDRRIVDVVDAVIKQSAPLNEPLPAACKRWKCRFSTKANAVTPEKSPVPPRKRTKRSSSKTELVSLENSHSNSTPPEPKSIEVSEIAKAVRERSRRRRDILQSTLSAPSSHVAEVVDAITDRVLEMCRRSPEISSSQIHTPPSNHAAEVVDAITDRVLEGCRGNHATEVVDAVTDRVLERSRRSPESLPPQIRTLISTVIDSPSTSNLEPPEVIIADETADDNSGWSNDEKQRLFDGLKIYGAKDLERLMDVVKTRSVLDILHYLKNHPLEKVSKICPDSKLEEWQEIAEYLTKGRRDYSVPTVKRVLQDKFWEEERKSSDRGVTSWKRDLHFGRIYLHLVNAIEGKQPVALTLTEKSIVNYLIYDLGKCTQTFASSPDKRTYFRKILAAYQQGSLATQPTPNANVSSFSEDALISLNPFCTPKDMLMKLPAPVADGLNINGRTDGGSTVDTIDGYNPVTSNVENSIHDGL